jgi:hypothetical protein
MAEAVLLIGTRKGLFIARSQDDRSAWSVEEIRFPMQSVYAIGVDNRSDTRGATPRIFANATSEHFGATLVHSDDLGATWSNQSSRRSGFPKMPVPRWNGSGRWSPVRTTPLGLSMRASSRPRSSGPRTTG